MKSSGGVAGGVRPDDPDTGFLNEAYQFILQKIAFLVYLGKPPATRTKVLIHFS
jgi:hypothetical protein